MLKRNRTQTFCNTNRIACKSSAKKQIACNESRLFDRSKNFLDEYRKQKELLHFCVRALFAWYAQGGFTSSVIFVKGRGNIEQILFSSLFSRLQQKTGCKRDMKKGKFTPSRTLHSIKTSWLSYAPTGLQQRHPAT